MPVSHKHKVIFVHIPKCAGSSIECMLGVRSIERNKKNKDGTTTTFLANNYESLFSADYNIKILNELRKKFTNIAEYKMCIGKNMQHYTYREICKVLPEEIINTYYTFSIVRNPYLRALSAYFHYTIAYNNNQLTFESFIDSIFKLTPFQRVKLYDGHMETQTSFLLDKNNTIANIDIFKMENLKECTAKLKQITEYSQLLRINISTKEKTLDYFTSSVREKIEKFYYDDFVNFNYSFDITQCLPTSK